MGHQEQRARRERLNRRLLGYTATAGAALAVAGAAGTANAEIIWDAGYSGGPAGISVCGGWNTSTPINLGAGPNFIFNEPGTFHSNAFMSLRGPSTAGVVAGLVAANNPGNTYAKPLHAVHSVANLIGPGRADWVNAALAGSTNWNANSGVKRLLQFSNSGPQFGPFTTRGVEDKYIGVRFAAAVPGGFDYGWIRVRGEQLRPKRYCLWLGLRQFRGGHLRGRHVIASRESRAEFVGPLGHGRTDGRGGGAAAPLEEGSLSGGQIVSVTRRVTVPTALGVRGILGACCQTAAGPFSGTMEQMANRLAKKVLLIGWDAADWKVINPLMDAGKMPHLERFVNAG